jgi:hypothetical protein
MSTVAWTVVSYTTNKNVDICYQPVLRVLIRYLALENDASRNLLLLTGSEQGGNSTPILVIVGRPLLWSLIVSLVPGKNWLVTEIHSSSECNNAYTHGSNVCG